MRITDMLGVLPTILQKNASDCIYLGGERHLQNIQHCLLQYI
jgi:hypothetical protein